MRKWQPKFDEPQDSSFTHELMALAHKVDGGPAWAVRYALLKSPDRTVIPVPGWAPTPDVADGSSLEDLWLYWADKGGGNGYSQEVAWCWTRPEYASEAVTHINRDLRANGHPLAFNTKPSTVKPSIPFVQVSEDLPPLLLDEDDPGWYVPHVLADTLIWQVAAQLIRRHPTDLWAINTYPMDGFYDCLTIVDVATMGDRVRVQMNRAGTSVEGAGPTLLRWNNSWEADDPREWLMNVERQAGLSAARPGLPPSTPASLAIRWTAQFMSMQLASRERWLSLGGLGPDEARPQELRGTGRDDDPRYWRLGHKTSSNLEPSVWVSIEGRLFFEDQPSVNLVAKRTPGEPISVLVARTVPQLLP